MPTQLAENSSKALKTPPHSQEAEQAVLGGLMLDNQAWDDVAGVLVEDDFYRQDHRLIFRAQEFLGEEGQPRDVVTLSEWLKSNDLLEDAGGIAYIGSLANDTPSAANIQAYARIVRSNSVLRQLSRVGADISNLGYEPEGRETPELLDEAERLVFHIADQGRKTSGGFKPIKEVLKEAVDRMDDMFHSESAFTGVPTGLSDFDDMTHGLQQSDLVIVAGRPSMGKTSFAMNIVENAAVAEKKAVAVFSMEMSADQLALRMISSLGRVNQERVRTGRLQDEDWHRVTSAVTMMSDAQLFIDDQPALSSTELRARARRLKREHDLGLVVVDYLQLMQLPGFKENRTAEISEISRNLKALAKELEVPVLALSQLNRNLEQRPNKRPVMSDLRESGGIEQDADLICFIYRDEVYNPDSEHKGIAEIIIGKQRNGPIGTCRTAFLGQFTRFESLAGEGYEDEGYS